MEQKHRPSVFKLCLIGILLLSVFLLVLIFWVLPRTESNSNIHNSTIPGTTETTPSSQPKEPTNPTLSPTEPPY